MTKVWQTVSMVQCTSIINVAILHSLYITWWWRWCFDHFGYLNQGYMPLKQCIGNNSLWVNLWLVNHKYVLDNLTVYSMHEKSSKGRSNLISNTSCLVPTSSSSISQIPRSVVREPSAPPAHLEAGTGYLSAPLSLDESPPTQSSASLIKAIREELLRLSQKQSYHSWGSSDPTC